MNVKSLHDWKSDFNIYYMLPSEKTFIKKAPTIICYSNLKITETNYLQSQLSSEFLLPKNFFQWINLSKTMRCSLTRCFFSFSGEYTAPSLQRKHTWVPLHAYKICRIICSSQRLIDSGVVDSQEDKLRQRLHTIFTPWNKIPNLSIISFIACKNQIYSKLKGMFWPFSWDKIPKHGFPLTYNTICMWYILQR